MMDTSTAMVTTLAEPGSIDTTQPPYYYPNTGPDACTIRELTLYVSQWLEAIYLVRVKGPSLRLPATFEIHRDQTAYSYHGELVQPIETRTGWMGTILIKPARGGSTNIIVPDGTPLNATDDHPTTQPTVVTTSSKIKIAKPPRFTGDKKNWEGFILAVDTYRMAYHEEFKSDEQKIWFVISYLGTDDSSQCVASDWIWNWKEENTYNHTLHADDYDKFLEDLWTAFEDPNLKVNAANDLQQLRQGKDTLTEASPSSNLKPLRPPRQRYHWPSQKSSMIWDMNRVVQRRNTPANRLWQNETEAAQHWDITWRRRIKERCFPSRSSNTTSTNNICSATPTEL